MGVSLNLKSFDGESNETFGNVVNSVGDDVDKPAHLNARYMGTNRDKEEMEILGKKQMLRRNFGFASMMAFCSTLIATWEIQLVNIQFPLLNGGAAGAVWGYIILCLGALAIYTSMAEIASMSPTAGGQYHWVSEFAPPRYQKFLSYITGWVCTSAWQCNVVGLCFSSALTIQGLIKLNHPDYVMEAWHGTLLAIAVVVFAVAFNVLLATKLPLVETLVLILHLVGIFLIIIPLWILSPRNSSKHVWTEFDNGGDWSSMGTSVMIGMGGQLGTMVGYDCAIHMAEEIHDASKNLPKAIISSVISNGLLGFVMTVTIAYTVTDVDKVLNTVTGQPFMEIFYQSTKHVPSATAMSVLTVILLIFCAISEMAAASRQVWSFARDGGMPGSGFLAKIPDGWNLPLNAVVLTVIVTSLITLLNLGSSTALQAIISLTLSSMFASYALSIGVVLRKRIVGEPLPEHRWSLGRWGMAVNIIALAWTLPMLVFCFFPQTSTVTPQSMNYAIAMFGGINVLAILYYFVRGRKFYTPPVAIMKRDD